MHIAACTPTPFRLDHERFFVRVVPLYGKWKFPKIGGTVLGIPAVRTIVYWGLYCGPPIWESYYVPHQLNVGEYPRFPHHS